MPAISIPMRLALGGDSAGQPLIQALHAHLRTQGKLETTDLSYDPPGTDTAEYYADMAGRIATAVAKGRFDRAILSCGTGIGVCISANKVSGIRAALCHDTYSAERAALSNNAQILTMGARVIGPELAKAIADTWLAARFDPEGRSAANVRAIEALDRHHRAATNSSSAPSSRSASASRSSTV